MVRKYFFDMFTHFFMAMERGDFKDQQHIQAVVRDGNMTFSGGQGVGAGLKRALGWGRGVGATAGGQVPHKQWPAHLAWDVGVLHKV